MVSCGSPIFCVWIEVAWIVSLMELGGVRGLGRAADRAGKRYGGSGV